MTINLKHKKIFKELGVDIVYLFGSHAYGRVTAMSDLDIGVVFTDIEKVKLIKSTVYDRLFRVFSEIYPREQKIDIVFLQLTSLALQTQVANRGKLLYERTKDSHYAYKFYAMTNHADFAYHINLQEQAKLERL